MNRKKSLIQVLLFLTFVGWFLILPASANSLTRKLFDYGLFEKRMEKISSNLGNRGKIYSIGKARGDYPILCIEIFPNSGKNRDEDPVLIYGGTHAVEWVSVEATLRLVEDILSELNGVDFKLDRPVLIIPLLNPGGYATLKYSPNLGDAGRKNGIYQPGDEKHYERINGADLNRNYSFAWEKGDKNSFSVYYRGKAPFSEPEVAAIRDLTEKRKPALAVSIHTPGHNILYPWSHTKEPVNDRELVSICDGLAKRIGNGFRSMADARNSLKYGSEVDWFYGVMKIPAFRVELATGLDDLAMKEYPEFSTAMRWLIRYPLTNRKR